MAKKENVDRSKLLGAMGLSQADFDALDANGKKAIDSLIKQFDRLKTASGDIKNVWDDLTASVAGVKINDFYSQIELSSQDIAQMVSDIHRLNDGIKDSASSLNADWIRSLNKGEAQIIDMIDRSTDLSTGMATALRKAVSSGNIGDFLQEQGAMGEDALKKLIASTGWKSLSKFVTSDGLKGYQDMNKELVRINQLYDTQGKKVVDIGRGVDKILANMTSAFTPEKWVGAMHDFDKIIHETQKNSGIMLADSTANEQQFTKLTTRAAQFGLSVQDSANMMMRLGAGLRTTNLDILHTASMDMAAMSSATGLSIDEVGELTSQMMLFGKTAKQVAKFSQDTMLSAYKYGVNGKKIMQDITKALPKARELGWMGGAEALKAMALQAERLGQNLDELIESSKKLRTLEGALEASADLALTGLNIDPLQMLGAARKDGKEYSDMIAQLGQGIGTFNEMTGEMDFNPLDNDILSRRAEAVGISVETLQKQLTKTAQDNQKIDLMPPGLFSSLKPEEQAFLLDQMKMQDGKVIDFNVNGVTDLSKLNADVLRSAAEKTARDKESLEKQAKQNMHFRESIDALKGSIMSMFTYLQPIIDAATSIVQGLTSWFGNLRTELQIAFAAGVGALALIYSAGKQVLAGYFFGLGFNKAAMGGGFLNSLKSLFRNPFAGATPPPAVGAGGAMGGGTLPGGIPTGNQAAGVSKLSEALRAMPSPQQLLALSVALVAFGAAIFGIGMGIKVAAEGLASLVTAFDGISNAGAALGAVAVVMGGFIGIIWAMVPAIAALSTVGAMGSLGLLALGAAFLGIGAGIYLASTGIANLVAQFSLLGNSITGTIGALVTSVAVIGGFVGIMYMMVPAIAALGAAGTAGAVGLIALSIAFLGIGAGIYLASTGIVKIVEAFGVLSNTLAPIKGAFATTAAVMVGFVGMMALMVPVIGALAAISTAGAVGLFALGVAFMGIGQGISLASNGLVKIIQSFDLLKGSSESINAAIGGVAVTLVGFALSVLAVVPAIYALGVAGTSGAIGLGVLALAFMGMGQGISLASSGLAAMVVSFKEVQNAGAAMGSIMAVMAGVIGTMYLLPPALIAIGTAMSAMGTMGWIAIPTLLALGGTFIGIGVGINLAATGIATLVKSFENLQGSLTNTIGAIAAGILIVGGFAGMLYIITPAIAALGAAGTAGAVGLIALGISFLGIGQGIKWASEGLAQMVTAFNGLENASSAMGAVIAVMAGAVGVMWLMPPVITAIGGALATLAALGSGAIPIVLALGGAMTLAGLGIKFAGEGIGNITKSIGNLFVTIIDGLKSSDKLSNFGAQLLMMVPALLAVGAAGVLAFPGLTAMSIGLALFGTSLSFVMPSLERLSALNLNNLEGVGKSLMALVPGLAAFAGISVLTPLIIGGAAGLYVLAPALNLLSNSFTNLSQVDWGTLTTVGSTLISLMPGLFAFSTLGLVSPLLIGATGALLLLSQGISALSGLDISGLSNLGDALSSSVLGLMAFSSVGLISPLLIAAAAALGVVGLSVSSFQSPNVEALSKVGDTLSSIVGSLFKFSSLAVITPLILTAAAGLSALGFALQVVGPAFNGLSGINFDVLNTIGNSISAAMPALMSFGMLGLLSVPMIAGAFALFSVGKLLSLAAAGFESFGNIKLDGFKRVASEIPSALVGMAAMSTIGILAAPIVAGATLLATAGLMLTSAALGFGSFTKIDWTALNASSPALEQFSDSIMSFAKIALVSTPLLIGTAALAASGTMLGVAAKGFKSITGVDWNELENVNTGISSLIPALGKLSLLSILAAPVMMGATMLGLTGLMFEKAAVGFQAMNSVNWSGIDKIGDSLSSLAPGLLSFAGVGLVSGLVLMTGIALQSVGKGLESLNGIDFNSLLGIGTAIDAITPALGKFAILGLLSAPIVLASGALSVFGLSLGSISNGIGSLANVDWSILQTAQQALSNSVPAFMQFAALGLLSAPIMLAAGALSVLGASMGSVSNGISSLASINWTGFAMAEDGLNGAIPTFMRFALLGALSAPIMLGAAALAVVGKSLGTAANGFVSMASVDWSQIEAMSNTLDSVIPGLVKFGMQGLVAVPGIMMMNSVLSRLSSTMGELSPALDMASQSLLSMSSSLERAKVAVKGIDTSSLNTLAAVSDKFSASQVVTQVQPVAQVQTTSGSQSKIKIDPITINLKLNGRDIQQEIVDANTHV